MIERVLHRANAATSQDSSGRSQDSSTPTELTNLSTNKSSQVRERRYRANAARSNDAHIVHAAIGHEDTTNRSQNSSSPTEVTNLSRNHSSQDSSSPTEVTNLSTNKSSQDTDRRYPLRKRTESTRYPEATYQKYTP